MKKIIYFLLLGLPLLLASQKNENSSESEDEKQIEERVINLENFSGIRVYSGINLTMIESDENKLVVKGSNADKMTTSIKKGELKIKYSIKRLFSEVESTNEVVLYYKGKINKVYTFQGSSVVCSDLLKATSFKIKASEGSRVVLFLDTYKVTTTSNTGGSVILAGKVNNHELTILAGGICEAEKLETEQTKVTVLAGGIAYVRTSVLLDAKVKSGGVIRLYGNPKKIISKKVVSGRIIEMPEE